MNDFQIWMKQLDFLIGTSKSNFETRKSCEIVTS